MAERETLIQSDFHFKVGDRRYDIPTADMLGGQIYYCDRRDRVTKRTIGRVRNMALDVTGLNKKTTLPEIGEYMRVARLSADQSAYDEMKARSEELLMPQYGLDYADDNDRRRFYDLFRNACKAVEVGREREIRERLESSGLDDDILAGLELQQESKFARDPLGLFENIVRSGNIKRSYESMFKLISALYIIPELINQEQYEDVANLVNAVLLKQEVFTDESPDIRGVVAKIYTTTGECTEWASRDESSRTELMSGRDDKGEWRELYVAYPSRYTSRGLPVYFTDREEKEGASVALKTLRKMKLSEDHYAARFVLDEKQGDIKSQIKMLLEHINDSFKAEKFQLTIDTKNGYTNTLTNQFYAQINDKLVEFSAKENEHNNTTSSERRVFQVDLTFTDANGVKRQFEVQILDTLSDLNRRFNERWGDPAYKVTQLFTPLEQRVSNNHNGKKPEDDTLASRLFPPYITRALSYPGLEESMKQKATSNAVNKERHRKLPQRNVTIFKNGQFKA